MAGKLIDLNAYMKTRTKQSCSQQSTCETSHADLDDFYRTRIRKLLTTVMEFPPERRVFISEELARQVNSKISRHDPDDQEFEQTRIRERRSSGSKKVRSSFQMTISLKEKMDDFVPANSGYPSSRNELIELAVRYFLRDFEAAGGVTDRLGFPESR